MHVRLARAAAAGWVAVCLGLAASRAGAGSYEQNFTAFALGATNFNDGSVLHSTHPGSIAAVADTNQKELQLTGAGFADARTAFVLPDLDPGQAVDAFSLFATAQVYAPTNTRGEGFSVTFGPIPADPASGVYTQEYHFAAGITLSARTSAADPNGGFRLYVNGAEAAFVPFTDWGHNNSVRHFFAMHLEGGALSATVDDAAIFVRQPVAYTPQAGDRFCVAARAVTNRTAEFRIDNVVAVTGTTIDDSAWLEPSASGAFPANEEPDKAFDRTAATKWLALGAASAHVQARAAEAMPRRVRAYSITSANDADTRDPLAWRLQGSRDGASWTNLDARAGGYWNRRLQRRAFLVASPGFYTWYRLQVDSNRGDANTQLADLRLLADPYLEPASSRVATTIADFDRWGLMVARGVAWVNAGGFTPGIVAGPAIGYVLQLTDGGAAELTAVAFERTGRLTDPRHGPAPVALVDFDLRVVPSNGQADGIALALLRTADFGDSGMGTPAAPNEEPDLTSAAGANFAVGFDVYNNGAPDPDNNHISVHYGTRLATATVPFDFSDGRFHHAQLRIAFRADRSGADVTVRMQENSLGMNSLASGTPVTLVSNLFVAGFTPYDFRVQFSGRTGGETAVQQIDNLYVLCGADAFAWGGDFHGADGALAVVGNATFRTDTGGAVYQHWLNLTDNGAGRYGSGWLNARPYLRRGFACDFEWRINFLGTGGADGLCFSVQNVDQAQNPGENGVPANALNFCFDTHLNAGEDPSDTLFRVRDGNRNLATVNLRTALFDFAYDPQRNPFAGRYAVHIDYAPGDLDVFVDDALVVDSLNVDLDALANGSALDADGTAWLGFSARTGGATENHDILTWRVATAAAPLPPAHTGTLLLVR